MEILKPAISENHMNASFYTGVIAEGKAKNGKSYALVCETEGEIYYNGKYLVGQQIVELGNDGVLTDDDFDEEMNESEVSILVDGWIVIAEVNNSGFETVLHAEEPDENRIFGYYDEAIQGFEDFLNKE